MHFLRNLFSRKPKSYLLDDKYEIVPAFEWNCETYYMHKDPLNTLAGRGLTSLVFMEEMLMRCDITYLRMHHEATEKLINTNVIKVGEIAKLNAHLKERIELLAAIPDHVYKLASVVFFTNKESPFKYDQEKGQAKVEAWKKAPGMYDFFLQTPLRELIPSLALPENNSPQYLSVVEKINDLHLTCLSDILSSKT